MSLRDAASIEAGFAAFEARGASASRRSWPMARGAAARRRPDGSGALVRDAFMRVAFRYLITETKLAWMYDHRIAW